MNFTVSTTLSWSQRTSSQKWKTHQERKARVRWSYLNNLTSKRLIKTRMKMKKKLTSVITSSFMIFGKNWLWKSLKRWVILEEFIATISNLFKVDTGNFTKCSFKKRILTNLSPVKKLKKKRLQKKIKMTKKLPKEKEWSRRTRKWDCKEEKQENS